MDPVEEAKKKIKAGQYRRQARYANSESELLHEEAKKDAWGRLSALIVKYKIEPDDVEEIMEISGFLL